MLKNILGNWGANLSDDAYAAGLAALGVLESRGTHQYHPSDDPDTIAAALAREFQNGDRTLLWRDSYRNVQRIEYWQETIHVNAAALAEGWRRYLHQVNHERQQPRLALNFGWRNRTDLFDFSALTEWLKYPATQISALVFSPGGGIRTVYISKVAFSTSGRILAGRIQYGCARIAK